jgi:hypothetical protein
MITPSGSSDLLSQYLTFASTLLWQCIIVAALFYYRRTIGALLGRVSKMEAFGIKLENSQAESKDALSPTKEVVEELQEVRPDRFLSNEQVKRVVDNAGVNATDEYARRTLLLLSNSNQQGWLVATDRALFYLLDTEKTRVSGRVIQWRLRFDDTQPIVVNEHNSTVRFGHRQNWLYSARLHSSPERLLQDIEIS